MKRTSLILALIGCSLFAASADVITRPDNWSKPVANGSLRNFYRVTPQLYRSKQPKASDIQSLKALGIRSVISLRDHHSDSAEFERQGIVSLEVPIAAGSMTSKQVIEALRLIDRAPKPVLVHCWHGGFHKIYLKRVTQILRSLDPHLIRKELEKEQSPRQVELPAAPESAPAHGLKDAGQHTSHAG